MSNNKPQKYDYWLWKNYFNPVQVKEFVKLIESNIHSDEPKDKAAFNLKGKPLKFLKTRLVYIRHLHKFLQPVLNSVYYINDKEFQWDLFRSFDNFELANWNIYSSKTKDRYHWHIDSTDGSSKYDTKFTVLINLSEKPYKGGEFKYFRHEAISIPDFKNPGAVLMFKSHLNHQVTPVTSGIRKTLTLFMHGPKFR